MTMGRRPPIVRLPRHQLPNVGPSGGVEPNVRTIVLMAGPGRGSNYNLHRRMIRDPSESWDEVNIDHSYGVARTRPGTKLAVAFTGGYDTIDAGTPERNWPWDRAVPGELARFWWLQHVIDEDAGLAGDERYRNYIAIGPFGQRDAIYVDAKSATGLASAIWDPIRYRTIPTASMWQCSLSGAGVLTFDSLAKTPAVALTDPKNYRIKDGFIQCLDSSVDPTKQQWFDILHNAGTAVYNASGYAGAGEVLHDCAFATPLIDLRNSHPGGGFSVYGIDAVPIPITNVGYRHSNSAGAFLNSRTSYACDGANLGSGGGPAWNTVMIEGMSFRFTDAISATYPLSFRWFGIDYLPAGGGAWVEPTVQRGVTHPSPLPATGNYEAVQFRQYFVTGAAGSSIVSAGTSPKQAQPYDDIPLYLANAAFVYDQRMFILYDVRFPEVNGDPDVQVGMVRWSASGTFTQFNNHITVGDALMDLGSGMWGFVMRGRAYVLHRDGITQIAATGRLNAPYSIQPIVTGHRFVPWLKPVSIDGTTQVLFGEDDIYVFDGSTPRKVTDGFSRFWKNWVDKRVSARRPAQAWLDQKRGRVYVSSGGDPSSDGATPDDVLVGDIQDKIWSLYQLPYATGGFAFQSTKGSTSGGIAFENDVELVGHTVQDVYNSAFSAHVDYIYVSRWSIDTDDDYLGNPGGITSTIRLLSQDLGDPGRFKTVKRIRFETQIEHESTTNATLTITSDTEGSVNKTVNFGGSAGDSGKVKLVQVDDLSLQGRLFDIELTLSSAQSKRLHIIRAEADYVLRGQITPV